MKNIFLDCGTHLCEGIKEFYEKKIIDNTFEIHTFEANPACDITNRIKELNLNITAYNCAVWIKNGVVKFNQENHKKSGTNSPTDGKSDFDGWGSSVDGIGFNHPGYETPIEVESIDFSEFINNLPKDSNIVCKMDIEGSEFEVLRHLIDKGSITRIKKLYIEFHDRFMKNESKQSVDILINKISEMGVDVYEWK